MLLAARRRHVSKWRSLVAGLAVAGLVGSACGSDSDVADSSDAAATTATASTGSPDTTETATDETTPVTGGTLNVGLFLEAASMDPVLVVSPATSVERAMAIFGNLMITVDGTPQPSLAESLEANDDATVWTLKLRPDAKFTDGTPYDADSIVYNINRHLEPDSQAAFKGLLETMISMEAIDDLTVEFTFSTPYGAFPAVLSDQASFGYIGSPTALAADPEGFGRNPIGAGPFMVKEWTVDQQMELVRNPDYVIEGQPYLDALTFQIIPDVDTRGQALQAGQVGFATNISPFTWATMKDDPAFYARQGAYTGGHALIWNQNVGAGQDPRVREAADIAFDTATTAAALTGDPTAFTAEQVDCVPFAVDRPECVKGDLPDQDLTRARELIADYIADGGSPDVQLMAFPTEPTLEYVQQTLNNIGLNVTIDRPPATEALGRYVNGEYEAAVYVIGTNPVFPRTFGAIYSKGQNRLQTTELDPYLEVIRDSPDEAEVLNAYRGLQDSLAESHILRWFAPLLVQMVASSNVHLGEAASTELANWGSTWVAP